MVPPEPSEAASFELPLSVRPGRPAARRDRAAPLPDPILLRNVFWFCRLRWMVVGLFAVLGLLGLFPHLWLRVGLYLPVDWPLAVAVVLAAGNTVFRLLAGWMRRRPSRLAPRMHLWAQIVFDLVVLTAVVHFVGSLGTSAPFAYLFHIVLACIFLTRLESLVVTLLACVLYTLCVVVEHVADLPMAGMYATGFVGAHLGLRTDVFLLNVGLGLAIWLTVWYLASELAAMVRVRDRRLAEANRRLEAAFEDRSRHMLRTTHELKAPFAAIHATAQVLLDGGYGALPEPAAAAVRRIADRCRRLANEIQEMVQLANLRSAGARRLPTARLDVAQTLQGCLAQARPLAEERGVRLESRLRAAWTVGVEEHLKMMLGNVIGNAIVYSHEGGRVEVTCGPDEAGRPVVTVADEGIGIPADKLPRIFDEYYRTNEAVRHNKQSSGLGLAIVREIAQTHGIRVRVTSRPGAGTMFRFRMPATVAGDPSVSPSGKEAHDVEDPAGR